MTTELCHGCGLVIPVHEERTLNDIPDQCWGRLPGVFSACCGHGHGGGFVMFENGVTIRFDRVEVEQPTPGFLQSGVYECFLRVRARREAG